MAVPAPFSYLITHLCGTGGAQGIGAATVALLHSLGAHVFFGDWDDVRGRKLEQDLNSGGTGGGSVYFQKLDVRDYTSQLALFDAAHSKHGKVDAAVSCAAVAEPEGWFEPEDLNLGTVRKVCLPFSFSHVLYSVIDGRR